VGSLALMRNGLASEVAEDNADMTVARRTRIVVCIIFADSMLEC
jgi:hypothetical protein